MFVQHTLRSLDARIVESFPQGPRVVELRPGTDIQAAQNRLSRTPGVRYVELNATLTLDATITNDPRADSLWGLDNPDDIDINAPEAWTITMGSHSTIVAVIDSGLDVNHPDLAGRIWVNPGEIAGNGRDDDRNGFIDDVNGWNFLSRNDDVLDQDGHGTHVSGTIAATANNGVGIVGAAPGTRIMPLKFIGPNGDGAISNAVSAIYYAVDHGARVINASWGGSSFSRSLEDAISYANSRNVVFVAAAGNESANNDTTSSYPANHKLPNVISVAAIDRQGNLAGFSSFGANSVHIAAPGVGILSTVPGGGYREFSGTSMATPHVAAVAALVISQNPTLTAAQVVERIVATARPLAGLAGKTISGGIVDAYAALTFGRATQTTGAVTSSPRVTSTDLRTVVLGSAEFHAVHGGTLEGFVHGLYQRVLGRTAEPAGLTLWTSALRSGFTRDEVARMVLGAEEAHRTTVARWFVEDLGRPASSLASLKNEPIVVEWAGQLARGVSIDQVRLGILASDEYYAINGGTPESYVDGLYRTLLGRPAESAGLTLWSSALRQGWNRADVANLIQTSPEARITTVAGWFANDLKRPTPLADLKNEPTVISWSRNARF